MKEEKKEIKLGKEKNGIFHYEGWKYNNEYNLSPENETLNFSKSEKPELTEIKLVDQEN